LYFIEIIPFLDCI